MKTLAIIAALAPLSVNAVLLDFHIRGSGAQQIPPNESPGRVGEGNNDLRGRNSKYDTELNRLWIQLEAWLPSKVTAAHLHGEPAPSELGAPGTIASELLSLSVSDGFQINEWFLEGSIFITEEQEENLLAGLWYVDVHTVDYPDGELRAQMTSYTEVVRTNVPEPWQYGLVSSLGLIGFALWRRR